MEVCVDSVVSAVNAEKGGACRVELCASLPEGGTTPSIGMLHVMKNHVSIPVFAMIRPRGGDFCYSPSEMEVMKKDITCLKEVGADGFVFGILTKEGDVDKDKCRELLDIVRPLPATFHRAIDMSRDILQSLADVVNLGFERVLSSGGSQTALQGVNILKEMIKQAEGQIIIVPGGGIRADNLEIILRISGATEFHGSARVAQDSPMNFQKSGISMGSEPSAEYVMKVASIESVHALISIAQAVWKT